MENAAGAINSNVVTLVRNEKSKHLQNLKDDPDNFIGFYGGDFEDIRKGYCAGFTEYFKLKMPEGILNKTDLLDLYSDEGQIYIAMLFGKESNESFTESSPKKTKFVNNETIERVIKSFKYGKDEDSEYGADGKYTRISDEARDDIYVFQALKDLLDREDRKYKGTYTTGRTGRTDGIKDGLKHDEYVIWDVPANLYFYACADSVKIPDTEKVCPGNPRKAARRFMKRENGEPKVNLFGDEGSPPGSPDTNQRTALNFDSPDSPDSPGNQKPVSRTLFGGKKNNKTRKSRKQVKSNKTNKTRKSRKQVKSNKNNKTRKTRKQVKYNKNNKTKKSRKSRK